MKPIKYRAEVELGNNGYVKPYPIKISLDSTTSKLYELEKQRDDFIEKSATEQGKILGFTPKEFWTHSLPFQLLALLDGWDKRAVKNACEAYLKINK